ncbi:MAG: hypothetical protein QXF12_06910 [Candidatus Aenigmatarchaeota archaeon]
MKSKVYQTIVEMLEEIKNKNSQEIKKINSTLNGLLKEIESHKIAFQQLNTKVLLIEQKLSSLDQNQEKNDSFKKIVSGIVYDFQNMKSRLEKQIALVENKTIILESKLNMNKSKSIDVTPLANSINEVRDMMGLSMKSMNAKLNEVLKRYEILQHRQNVIEKLLNLSTSLDEFSINKNLDELSELIKNLKELDGLDESLQQTIYRYADSLASYMLASGYEDLSNTIKNRISQIV